MTHTTEDRIREEWRNEFGNPPLEMMERFTQKMSRCALCGIQADAIADWWLSKLASEKEMVRSELREKIEKLKKPIMGDPSMTDPLGGMRNDALNEILSLLSPSKE